MNCSTSPGTPAAASSTAASSGTSRTVTDCCRPAVVATSGRQPGAALEPGRTEGSSRSRPRPPAPRAAGTRLPDAGHDVAVDRGAWPSARARSAARAAAADRQQRGGDQRARPVSRRARRRRGRPCRPGRAVPAPGCSDDVRPGGRGSPAEPAAGPAVPSTSAATPVTTCSRCGRHEDGAALLAAVEPGDDRREPGRPGQAQPERLPDGDPAEPGLVDAGLPRGEQPAASGARCPSRPVWLRVKPQLVTR